MRVREARRGDEAALLALARGLDSVNLPADPQAIDALVARSVDRATQDAVHVLVLEHEGRLVGTSMILARHGTPELPHYALEDDGRGSLVLTAETAGVTELGGLVLDRAHRGDRRAGRPLSLARLLFVALHRERFRDRLLAELMPELDERGSAPLWPHLAGRSSAMSYREADRRSREDKRFIPALFARGAVELDSIPAPLRAALGREGRSASPARRMLESLGLEHRGAIDPFDGGPHVEARTDDVLARLAPRALVLSDVEASSADASDLLVASAEPGGFALVRTRGVTDGASLALEPGARAELGLSSGARVLAAAPSGASTSMQ